MEVWCQATFFRNRTEREAAWQAAFPLMITKPMSAA
jgi:hypothetical protein